MATMKTRLQRSLAAWRRQLGSGGVDVDASERASAERATFRTDQRILAILRPGSRADVEACLRIAHRHRVPVYPTSRGKNWGYGSRVPVRDGCVLLHLGRMNRIVGFSEKLAYVTVEPGVTFRDLARFLARRRSRLMPARIGGSPDASILGNALERGLGQGLGTDRVANVCALQVVLPTGETIETGFARFPKAAAAPLHRWGLGPSLDGLFSQSNFGVVTRLTLWLSPRPAHEEALVFEVEEDARLAQIIDALAAVRRRGLLPSGGVISSRPRIFALSEQYPWGESRGRTPLPDDVIAALRDHGGILKWRGILEVQAESPDHLAALRSLLLDALAGRVDDAVAKPISSHDAGLERTDSLRLAYWRKRTPPPGDMDPDRDRCGVLFLAPVVPFDGACVLEVTQLVEQTMLAEGFDPIIAIALIDERVVYVNVVIVFDRDVPGEDDRALVCHARLSRHLADLGYYPYRLGIQSMTQLAAGDDAYATLLARIKRTLDPRGILAPGRYMPTKSNVKPKGDSALRRRRRTS
jgi:4-cresol dehydrogenase (hydroxylating)